jgi:hypothetical protein
MHRAPKQAAAFLGLASLLCACGSAGSDGGQTGGSGGTSLSAIPGLWDGGSQGVQVCFFVGEDGRSLTSVGSTCDLAEPAGGEARSFELRIEDVGVDDEGQPCSLELAFTAEVPIDPRTGAFRVSGAPTPDGDATFSFSGEVSDRQASGVARLEQGSSVCQVGWAASKASSCDQAAIDTCFALQQCCLSILVNPVFFESCNSVVLQCDRAACQALLDGYPRCRERE